jgi:Fe-S oxidoreductase
MWMEETGGTKINIDRAQDLAETGATQIATASPFSYIMLDDGIKTSGRQDIQVADISIHLLNAIESHNTLKTGP